MRCFQTEESACHRYRLITDTVTDAPYI